MDIYIKPKKKAVIKGVKEIKIKDICDVVADKEVYKSICDITLIKVKTELLDKKKNECYLVSITDIIKNIKNKYSNSNILNIGEMDTLVEYSLEEKKENKLFGWAKVAFVCLILFMGSLIAIMSFYSDAQMSEVFKNSHKIIFGEETAYPFLLEISYSIGLCTGIIVFFNHFLGHKLTSDPTPIEIEIAKYESDLVDSVIDDLDAKKDRMKGGRK